MNKFYVFSSVNETLKEIAVFATMAGAVEHANENRNEFLKECFDNISGDMVGDGKVYNLESLGKQQEEATAENPVASFSIGGVAFKAVIETQTSKVPEPETVSKPVMPKNKDELAEFLEYLFEVDTDDDDDDDCGCGCGCNCAENEKEEAITDEDFEALVDETANSLEGLVDLVEKVMATTNTSPAHKVDPEAVNLLKKSFVATGRMVEELKLMKKEKLEKDDSEEEALLKFFESVFSK